MEKVVQIIDGDRASLEARVVRALGADGLDCIVARFTYWYTGRPPVYEALLFRRSLAE
jgi:hypothetical protein